jgi:polygalacturonase
MQHPTNRHARNILILFFMTALLGLQTASAQHTEATGWDAVPVLLKKIVPPTFPARRFSIMDQGAVADGRTDCLPAIKKAISACHQAGGGMVIVPGGNYFVKGPIHLLSGVNLHFEKGAVLKFSTDADDYLPLVLTRFEGMELMNYSPLIYAYGQKNIAVTGPGILDGQADNEHWWNWTGSKRFGWKPGMGAQHAPQNEPALAKMAATGVTARQRIFGKGHYMRPSFLEFYHCSNILIQGVTIKNTPFWILHPTLSKNITVDSVTTLSFGPNTDGCDPESCTDVLIKNCVFNDGDDCIAIKSGRNEDGRRIGVPSQNIIIEDCVMHDGHGGVVIGSETSGGVENVYARNCIMNSPHLNRAIRIKSNACRGGVLKNFYFSHIQVGQVSEAVIRVTMFYGNENSADCHFPPTLDGVHIDHITSKKSKYAINIQGRKDKPVRNITISDCSFNGVQEENIIQDATGVTVLGTTINGKTVTRP